ncbi:MAG TPA: hypothetical protein VKR38_08660 [Usitatibacter sp.]|nr:hypothetical protein [Usitatibacter sp.]
MKIKALSIAVSAALLMGTVTLSSAQTINNPATSNSTTPSTSGAPTAPANPNSTSDQGMTKKTENAVDNAIDKLPPKRTMTRAEYSSEKDSIKADYKSAKQSCDSMTGNAKSVCNVQAKSDEKVKMADLEAKYKGTPSADTDAKVAKAKAEYEVAKQKCDDQTGADRSTCKANAKSEQDRAISDAKAAAKTASSN